MQRYTDQEYKKIFEALPTEIKEVILSYDSVEKIWAIGKKHNLHVDKIDKMNSVTLDVMMGITPARNIVPELAKELEIPELEASKLAFDIDEKIFKPIKEIMKKVYGDGSPMRPKPSYRYVHDEDEKDIESHTSRANLLKEIEAPEEASVKRIVINPPKPVNVPLKTPEVETTQPTTESIVMDESLKQKREKLLQSIADKKLNSVTVMKEEEVFPEVILPPIIPQTTKTVAKDITSSKAEAPIQKPKRKIIDPFLQTEPLMEVGTSSLSLPTDTLKLQDKIIDPYREPIE